MWNYAGSNPSKHDSPRSGKAEVAWQENTVPTTPAEEICEERVQQSKRKSENVNEFRTAKFVPVRDFSMRVPEPIGSTFVNQSPVPCWSG